MNPKRELGYWIGIGTLIVLPTVFGLVARESHRPLVDPIYSSVAVGLLVVALLVLARQATPDVPLDEAIVAVLEGGPCTLSRLRRTMRVTSDGQRWFERTLMHLITTGRVEVTQADGEPVYRLVSSAVIE